MSLDKKSSSPDKLFLREKIMSKLPYATILVAEDNEDSRLMLRLFLENLEYNVIEAKNGEEAVRLAEQKVPDLILMDLNMPEMDGVTAATVIRNFTELSNVPIIAMSAYGDLAISLFLNVHSETVISNMLPSRLIWKI